MKCLLLTFIAIVGMAAATPTLPWLDEPNPPSRSYSARPLSPPPKSDGKILGGLKSILGQNSEYQGVAHGNVGDKAVAAANKGWDKAYGHLPQTSPSEHETNHFPTEPYEMITTIPETIPKSDPNPKWQPWLRKLKLKPSLKKPSPENQDIHNEIKGASQTWDPSLDLEQLAAGHMKLNKDMVKFPVQEPPPYIIEKIKLQQRSEERYRQEQEEKRLAAEKKAGSWLTFAKNRFLDAVGPER
jgi:hypothetical protein